MTNAFKKLCFLLLLFFGVLQGNTQMRNIYEDNVAGNEISKISFYSPTNGYVAFRDWIGFTSDSGRTFVKKFVTLGNVDYNGNSVNLTFGFGIEGVKAFSQDTLIAYGDYGFVPAILYSVNGGNTFKLVYHSQYNPMQISGGVADMVFPTNGSIGYAVDPDRILKTTTRGASWTVVQTLPGSFLNRLEAADNNNLFAYSSDYVTNKLLSTANGGVTWQTVTLPYNTRINSASFRTPYRGWINVRNNNSVGETYFTTNGGSSWVRKNNPNITPFSTSKMQFINDSTGFALAGLFEVYKTTDSGKVWQPLPRNTNYTYLGYSHNDLFIWNASQFWAGGGHGFLEITSNGGGTPYPKAYFDVDTVGAAATNLVKLVNYSKGGYQYKWFVNGTLLSTNYHASYNHNVYQVFDTIKLVVINGSLSDTLERVQSVGAIPKPLITALSPNSGTLGSVITISGNHFISTSSIMFGNFPAASFQILSPTTIRAVVGDGGSGRVKVITAGGSDSLSGFTFVPPPPLIDSFSPSTIIPGTTVTIWGKFFANASAVQFGGVAASSFSIVSPTKIVAITGSGASGSVSITTPTGTGSRAGITFIPPVSVTSISPLSGPVGTVVTIIGSNFNLNPANNVVFFGAVRATVLTATSTLLTVQAPAGASYQPVTVTVNGQTASSQKRFSITFPGGGTITNNSFVAAGTYEIYPTSYDNYYGSTGDIDGDGKVDVITGNTNQVSSVSIFRNTSSAGGYITFAPRMDKFISQLGIVRNLLYDLNADGKPDLVAVGNGLQVAKNISTPGNINFDTLQRFHTYASGWGMAIEDIDGDGRPDVAVPGEYDDNVVVMRNNGSDGNISFESRIDLAAGDTPLSVALADLDGDKKVDLIVPNYYDRNFMIYRNISEPGKIVFAPKVTISLNTGSRDIGIADFDGDGRVDIVLASASISVLKNTSTGPGNFSFATPVNGAVLALNSVETGDVNGDGKPDIITANLSDQNIAVFENTTSGGSISFAPKVTFSTPPNGYPRHAPLADLNNDGKTDIVSNNTNGRSITIFKNRMNTSPADAGMDTTICSGKSIQIGSPALFGHTYSWTSNPSGLTSTAASPVVSPSVTTTYYLAVNDGNALYYDTVMVVVKTSPQVNGGPDRFICSGNSVTIGTPAITGNTYLWTPATGLNSATAAEPLASPSFSTNYYLTVSNSVGCTVYDTVTVLVASSLNVTVTPAYPGICSGSSTVLTASGASTYTWSPATGLNTTLGASVVAAPSATTTYSVTGSNSGCSGTNSVTVTVTPATTPSVLINYSGCSSGSLTFTATPVNGGSAPQFQWYVNNVLQSNQNALTLTGAANGTQVYVRMTSNKGCALPQTVNSAVTTINCVTTAVPAIDVLENYTISPNPTRGLLVIQLKLRQRKRVAFAVTNVSGKSVYEGVPFSASGNITKQIDLSGRPAGNYYLKTTIGDDSFIEKILIVR